MMGKHEPPQMQLFYHNITIETFVPPDHELRQIDTIIDFDFVYKKVEPLYGTNGNVSVPPSTILKYMFLLFYYDVASERRLMYETQFRMDWRWFLGYDLDSPIPDHSVLSKARKRWGKEAFEEFFESMVWQCVEAGLVGGEKVFCDSSLVDADASGSSVVDRQKFRRYWNKRYRELEVRLEEIGDERRYVSTTDPDASVVRAGKGKAKPRYAAHRAVDSNKGVITATETTPGAVNEAHMLTELLDGHQASTHRKAGVVVADSKYGTVENFLKLSERDVRGHIPDLGRCQKGSNRRAGIFDISEFVYDEETDTYVCPAGERLSPRNRMKKRKAIEYSALKKTCQVCELRDHCTRNASGSRTIKRHDRQKELDRMRRISESSQSRSDLKTRKHFMERSYADAANNHGFKRSRWRGLEKATIQDLLIAAVQNIRILIRHWTKPAGVAQEMRIVERKAARIAAVLYQALCSTVMSLPWVIRPAHCCYSGVNHS
jgi:transposase